MRVERKKFDSEIHRRIKKLYAYDNWHAMVALLWDYFLIVLAVWIAEFSYWFLPLSLLIIGSRQRALATILHEASHYALCKHKKIRADFRYLFFWISDFSKLE